MERRLAAILVADVVGYSRLMSEDEAGTLRALTSLRKTTIEPLIASHKGHVVKLMGDGFLVEFQSVVDAVTCAIAWQRSVGAGDAEQLLSFRIGVNLGDVISEDSDIYGDGVNVAARLQEIAEPGGVMLSATVLEHIRGKVDIAVDDRGDQQLKNIGRPVHVYAVKAVQHRGALRSGSAKAMSLPDKPSIAVLPFANMSGDVDQEYFSDGIAEDIITELSRFRSLFVIARNSSFAYKGRSVDTRAIARDLGVRYILEGSVRRAGNLVRVTAQLIDASSGSHLWAERIDRQLENIFAVQDEITQRIVDSIAPRIDAAGLETAKRKPPEDMRAYDYYLRAKWLIDTPHSVGNFDQARDYCDRAIQLDPSYARAYAYKALSYVIEILLLEAQDLESSRRMALENAEAALALDPMDGVSHWAVGEAALQSKQRERALEHIDRALAMNPNDADVMAISGYIHTATGDSQTGLRHMEMAIERNPYHPTWYQWLRGLILLAAFQYEEALRAFDRFGVPNSSALRWRAVTLVELGRIEEAKADIRVLLEMQPGATVGKVKQYFEYLPNLAQILDALRRAGLPE